MADRILRQTCQERGTGEGKKRVMLTRLIQIKGSYSGNAVKILVTTGLETKVILYGSLDAKFLSAKRGDVEVHLQYLPLGILLRQANGQGCLGKFALQRNLGIMGEVFD